MQSNQIGHLNQEVANQRLEIDQIRTYLINQSVSQSRGDVKVKQPKKIETKIKPKVEPQIVRFMPKMEPQVVPHVRRITAARMVTGVRAPVLQTEQQVMPQRLPKFLPPIEYEYDVVKVSSPTVSVLPNTECPLQMANVHLICLTKFRFCILGTGNSIAHRAPAAAHFLVCRLVRPVRHCQMLASIQSAGPSRIRSQIRQQIAAHHAQ